MRIVCIIQARMGSSRLPGKVMMKLADREALWHVYQRVTQCKLIHQTVIATTHNSLDNSICSYCHSHEWPCYRGSELDVLRRYTEAATFYGADVVVRVTSDCPLVDPKILGKLIAKFDEGYDYVSTNYPKRTFPVGLDCEVMSIQALKQAHAGALDEYDREHVTPYFYRNPTLFKLGSLANNIDQSGVRLTLDTQDDYERLAKIYDSLYANGEIVDIGSAVALASKMTPLA